MRRVVAVTVCGDLLTLWGQVIATDGGEPRRVERIVVLRRPQGAWRGVRRPGLSSGLLAVSLGPVCRWLHFHVEPRLRLSLLMGRSEIPPELPGMRGRWPGEPSPERYGR